MPRLRFMKIYSKVPNKRPPPPLRLFFKTKSDPPAVIRTPPPHPGLVIFGFSSLAPKKFGQCKTYLNIRNSIKSNEIDFFECFHFQCYF